MSYRRPMFQFLICAVASLSFSGITAAQGFPIQPVPFTDVNVLDSFWTPRLEANRRTTIWYDFRKCEETGRIDNFAVAGKLKEGGFRGIYFNDSDVFKVIEGAAYSLAVQKDDELDDYLDKLIAKIAAAQEDDGYLYTARTINDPKYDYPGKEGGRWSNLAYGHELYNVGHMYEAAVAHWQATGKRSLLDVAIKNADLVCKVFGPGEGQRVDVPGHQEIEIGLVRLYRATGNDKYLQQAKFFIDNRGQKGARKLYGEYSQDHQPISKQSEAVGHAVRGGYFYSGIADVAALTGDREYTEAIDRIWENIVSKKMHLTGGIGATRHGEAFGANYELPNETAYLETCAAISNAMFNHRMFLLHGDAKYIDVLERVIYNGFLSGVSLSGDRFFYPNPLACNGRTKFNIGNLGRAPWFDCSCCPVNIVRFVPSIPSYIYAVRKNAVYVNLFIGGTGKLKLSDQVVTLKQHTRYPNDGKIRIEVQPEKANQEFAIHVRIPGWVQGTPAPGNLYQYVNATPAEYRVRLNGKPVQPMKLVDGYLVLNRRWKVGDAIELDFPMPIRRVLAREEVKANRSRVALERGPLVYCLEGTDHNASVFSIFLTDDMSLSSSFSKGLLGGITVLHGASKRKVQDADGTVRLVPTQLSAIPYYAWAHRDVGEMVVWMARDPEIIKSKPAPTFVSKANASASHCWNSDTTDAMNDQLEPENSNDHSIPRLTFWDHRGGTEWVQYDFDKLQKLSQIDVYWFDDTGIGNCRIPKSWRALYWNQGKWTPVTNATAYGVKKDQFNSVNFKEIQTSKLRLEIELQPEFSGGILEWKAK